MAERDDQTEENERRENALRFIRHPTAFVYSEEDYARLRLQTTDGLTEPPAATQTEST